MPRVAIFGGTFNPLHIGHYQMLKALNECKDIDKIFLMPDKIPPHKVCDFMASDEERIEMCRIAAKDFNKCELCLIEFEREGKSYTYDTVKLLKEKFENFEFYFVCGGDMLVYFDKWYRFKDLMKELGFIVFKRSDTDITEFNACVEKFTEMGMNINLMEETISNISSTEIRGDKSKAQKYLPQKIYEYILEKSIYFE